MRLCQRLGDAIHHSEKTVIKSRPPAKPLAWESPIRTSYRHASQEARKSVFSITRPAAANAAKRLLLEEKLSPSGD